MDQLGVNRRRLLQVALAAPVAVAGAAAVPATAEAVEVAGAGVADSASPRFVLAVFPDTQYLFDDGGTDDAPVRATLTHLVRHRREDTIAFMAHLGDVTEHGTVTEMRQADQVFAAIDGRLPYSVLAGNHDVRSGDDQRGASPYLATFGPSRFARSASYGGSSPDGYNSFHVFQAGGRSWLVLALDWRVSDRGIGWAQQVLDEHRDLPVILSTHDLVAPVGTGGAELSEHGKHLWDKLIRRNDQIFLTLNGHWWPVGRTTLTNDAGHPVHLHLTNYQDRYYGGAGMIRYYSFDLARNVIDVETFSPWLLGQRVRDRTKLAAETLELSGAADRFTVEIDFAQRFAGFAPPAAPPARPAKAVLTRDTVAYWRFDAEGFAGGRDGEAVAPGAVARDLTGHGNDLFVQRLGTSGPDALTFSADHHVGQPAHSSLRFGGGKSPDRGAVLRAGAAAPVNSLRFENGYTIETFLKLPEPFVGDHGFMGILSWEGRSGDAGKHSGWSPDEPTCSLNLSGEYFLQFVVYPTDRDADPTSWSHALPLGRWTHVAVVNDGHHTTMFVDGSKIARNAGEDSRGITTLGKPFVIGATQFAGRFGQGFYGWIGDTRIVARALRPSQFLTAT